MTWAINPYNGALEHDIYDLEGPWLIYHFNGELLITYGNAIRTPRNWTIT